MIKHELVTIASIVLSTVAQYETILRYVDILSLSLSHLPSPDAEDGEAR